MQNNTLFSDNYLQNRLPLLPEWTEDVIPLFVEIQRLMKLAQQFGNSWNEAQTEEEFIKPVLRLLGWSFIVQPTAQHGGQTTRPDYALFSDEVAKTEAQPFAGNDEAFYSRALVITEAKYWGRPLSQRDNSGRETWKSGSNPSHQMVSYLVGTRTPWGILTNGQVWRLYSREVSSTASEFYEIDLSLIFDFLPANGEPTPTQIEDFKRWWLFFRKLSFVPDMQGKSFVQLAQEGSTAYAREISEQLKKIVFQEVMPQIAGGFVQYRKLQLHIDQETPESLNEIYIASLSLLYKLLFLLYAEARSLLPMDNPDYRDNSLMNIARWAATQIDQQRNLSEATFATPRYDALLALFRRIDMGDRALGIPHYNGGLFNPNTPENQFLENHKISDKTVAQVIDRLVRDQGQSVDYAYISVRNLGAIYEGLLENKLNVIDSPTGQVELINDKGERKATGSYYTPDYIVEYIVQNTLDPILEERDSEYELAMDKVTKIRQNLLRAVNPSINRFLQQSLSSAENEAREAFLGIKVLDPAMGSGHFLVNAVDHLTDGIIQRTQTYHDTHPKALLEWDPIQQMIDHVREGILSEMAEQGLRIDSRRLDDTALLTRLVMKRCIYGVDLNQMAVELTKVSLWLHSFTIGAPLSFLDHHLRCGNSLIGTDVKTVERGMASTKMEMAISKASKKLAKGRGEISREKTAVVQDNLFAGPFAGLLDLTSIMIEVAERADATLADVHQSAEDYASFQQILTPYKQVLNLWVSQYFGNTDAVEFLTFSGDGVLPVLRGDQPVIEKYQLTIRKADKLQKEKLFFHWDLEFPEVFIDLQKRDWAENPGFDAIIGNPPYDVLIKSEQGTQIIHYVNNNFETAEYNPNLYSLFSEKAINLLAKNGQVSLIIPNTWLTNQKFSRLRGVLINRVNLTQVLDLNFTVFSVVVPTAIFLANKSEYYSS